MKNQPRPAPCPGGARVSFNEKQIERLRDARREGTPIKLLAREYNVSPGRISALTRGWKSTGGCDGVR